MEWEIAKMRGPADWKPALDGNRMLILSAEGKAKRPTEELAHERNRLTAVLAKNVLVAHANPGGKTETLAKEILSWKIPVATFADQNNANLLALGAKAWEFNMSWKNKIKSMETYKKPTDSNDFQITCNIEEDDFIYLLQNDLWSKDEAGPEDVNADKNIEGLCSLSGVGKLHKFKSLAIRTCKCQGESLMGYGPEIFVVVDFNKVASDLVISSGDFKNVALKAIELGKSEEIKVFLCKGMSKLEILKELDSLVIKDKSDEIARKEKGLPYLPCLSDYYEARLLRSLTMADVTEIYAEELTIPCLLSLSPRDKKATTSHCKKKK